jgi:hypothetical protein
VTTGARAVPLVNVALSHSSFAPAIRLAAAGLGVVVTAVAAQVPLPLPFTPVPSRG